MRKVFIVVAGGNAAAEKHFEDTIQTKRSVEEVKKFLPAEETKNLEDIYHGSSFIVWGAIPGPMNERRWEKMEPGDLVLIYNSGHIRVIGEVAAKARSKELSKYFWKETAGGDTWELIYFIVNEEKVNLPVESINPFFGYATSYRPMGFSQINDEAIEKFVTNYGDIRGVINTLQKGEHVAEIPESAKKIVEVAEEQIEKPVTEHTEMQWRLIRLGMLAKCDIWVPANDQGREYEGNVFREHVMSEFNTGMDVPLTIKNVDVVWKFGPYSIRSAFEVEHSTSVYSGILRLSDLRAGNPNSSYPLYVVAAKDRRRKVFDELRRPTFSGPCLRLNEVIRFLSYDSVRDLDEEFKNKGEFDSDLLVMASELVEI